MQALRIEKVHVWGVWENQQYWKDVAVLIFWEKIYGQDPNG